MSYVNELIDLYNKNQDKIGVIEYRGDIPYVLLPPFHTTVTAQITVTIDQNENFMRAELVAQDVKMTEYVMNCICLKLKNGKNQHILMKK